MPWFSKKDKSSLTYLNCTQFLGVLNDNLYKLLMVFLLIDTLGKTKAASILSAAGATYVAPFLLFSSSAGILADRFSKQKLIFGLKIAEVMIMGLGIVAFGFKSPWACYTLLFLLATHSAMFGPSKYGIIPELVPKEQVSKANGLITSFTYIAIIVGTFLASFTTEISNRNFVITGFFCFAVAVTGFLTSIKIKQTPAQGSEKKINPLFVREIYQTLLFSSSIKYLLAAIFGSSYFLFVGAFVQLNIIPFAIESLGLKEVSGGYLFLVVAIGIASGSLLCGRWARKKLELGISCLAGFVIGGCFIFISLFSFSLFTTVFLLILLGLAGGIFIIPFDTFIQLSSPVEKRGQIIAAANFLSFTGVLVASFALYFFSDVLEFSPSFGFGIIGIVTIGVSFLLSIRLSETTFPFFAKKLLFPYYNVSVLEAEKIESTSCLLVLENSSPVRTLLAIGAIPSIHLLLPKQPKRPFWYSWIRSLDEMDMEASTAQLMENAKEFLSSYEHPCLLLKGNLLLEKVQEEPMFKNLFKYDKVYCIDIKRDELNKKMIISFRKI